MGSCSLSALLLALLALIFSKLSHALLPNQPLQDNSFFQPPSSLAAGVEYPEVSSAPDRGRLEAALTSPDPLTVLRNATTQPSDNRIHFLCNGAEYGYDLPLRSCIGALVLIPDVARKFSFGPRVPGRYNFETPARLLSGDGLCAVDLVRQFDAATENARGKDLVEAGQRLLTECYSDDRQGGIVRNLGEGSPTVIPQSRSGSHAEAMIWLNLQ
ncbi:MAG: hypothetical protein Q9220_004866 [cf. Caloplaca sp. 1 TL-2023]